MLNQVQHDDMVQTDARSNRNRADLTHYFVRPELVEGLLSFLLTRKRKAGLRQAQPERNDVIFPSP
jgi:hypothetical protein